MAFFHRSFLLIFPHPMITLYVILNGVKWCVPRWRILIIIRRRLLLLFLPRLILWVVGGFFEPNLGPMGLWNVTRLISLLKGSVKFRALTFLTPSVLLSRWLLFVLFLLLRLLTGSICVNLTWITPFSTAIWVTLSLWINPQVLRMPVILIMFVSSIKLFMVLIRPHCVVSST